MEAPPIMRSSVGCISTLRLPCSIKYPPATAPKTTKIPIIANMNDSLRRRLPASPIRAALYRPLTTETSINFVRPLLRTLRDGQPFWIQMWQIERSCHGVQHGFEQVEPVDRRYSLPEKAKYHGRCFRLIGENRFKIYRVPAFYGDHRIFNFAPVVVNVVTDTQRIFSIHRSELDGHGPLLHDTRMTTEHVEVVCTVDSGPANQVSGGIGEMVMPGMRGGVIQYTIPFVE